MLSIAATVLGGIGLFLLGMILMTDGLKAAAGSALRNVLGRFTDTTPRALASGVGLTALVQSSSATTVTTIGFVSAGLMTFPQALGVILGANLGSTSTGWLVGLFGLKLSISTIALPMIGVGALMRLLLRDRWAQAGMALAGFGVIFVGIDVLQSGTAGLAETIDLSVWATRSWGSWALLVGIGALMTVLMQSSSAAVATTLTALYSGAIEIDQAAALVIGQNLGTTVKAALISIGASIPAKRTALAHILFNVATGVVAFALLPVFVWSVDTWMVAFTQGDEALVIATFHTVFNLMGILLFVPILTPFAQYVERLIPDDAPSLTRYLDDSVMEVPSMASEAARRAVQSTAAAVLKRAPACLDPKRPPPDWAAIQEALTDTRAFVGKLDALNDADESERHLSTLHALDHLDRLVRALQERPNTPASLYETEVQPLEHTLRPAWRQVRQQMEREEAAQNGAADQRYEAIDTIRDAAETLADRRRTQRPQLFQRIATDQLPPDDALTVLAHLRWLDRIAYHTWRITHHLIGNGVAEDEPDAATAFAERGAFSPAA